MTANDAKVKKVTGMDVGFGRIVDDIIRERGFCYEHARREAHVLLEEMIKMDNQARKNQWFLCQLWE